MVTFPSKVLNDGKIYGAGVCVSRDEKPTDDIANGSQLVEMDTGDVYMFDEEAETWRKVT